MYSPFGAAFRAAGRDMAIVCCDVESVMKSLGFVAYGFAV